MGLHLAVVGAFDVDDLLALFLLWSEKVHVDAKRLVANLYEHVLVFEQFAVDPFAFDERGGVVLDAFDFVDSVVGPTQARHQGMFVGISVGENLTRSIADRGSGALGQLVLRFLLSCLVLLLGRRLGDVERALCARSWLPVRDLGRRRGDKQGGCQQDGESREFAATVEK